VNSTGKLHTPNARKLNPLEISLPDGSTATYPEDFEESGSITLNESLTVGNNTISVDTPVENNMETEVNLCAVH